ncbi:hypothetical protein DFJ73DRAFT_913761 [Zopfochytrium polystomum]|nr:hypothetical protein DFJ73DRAFT_913761 [Zopfochytrium polystomum]
MRWQYARQCDGVVLVYSIASRGSFGEAFKLRAEIARRREVSELDGRIAARAMRADAFLEASAKTGVNVNNVFEAVVRCVLDEKRIVGSTAVDRRRTPLSIMVKSSPSTTRFNPSLAPAASPPPTHPPFPPPPDGAASADHDNAPSHDHGGGGGTPFALQTAGHKDAILSLSPSVLAKPLSAIELAFYRDAAAPASAAAPATDRGIHLRPFLPSFLGLATLSPAATPTPIPATPATQTPTPTPKDAIPTPPPASHPPPPPAPTHIKLANVLHPLRRPSVMDVKLGTRLYGDDAAAAKRARMEAQAAATTSGATGVRVCGMKRYDPSTSAYITHDRTFGRSLTPETLTAGVRTFFTIPSCSSSLSSLDKDAGVRLIPARTVAAVVRRLRRLRAAVAATTACRMYGASVLVAYECCAEEGGVAGKRKRGVGAGDGEGRKKRRVGKVAREAEGEEEEETVEQEEEDEGEEKPDGDDGAVLAAVADGERATDGTARGVKRAHNSDDSDSANPTSQRRRLPSTTPTTMMSTATGTDRVVVSLIDFAHSRFLSADELAAEQAAAGGARADAGVLLGLDNLIGYVEAVLAEAEAAEAVGG